MTIHTLHWTRRHSHQYSGWTMMSWYGRATSPIATAATATNVARRGLPSRVKDKLRELPLTSSSTLRFKFKLCSDCSPPLVHVAHQWLPEPIQPLPRIRAPACQALHSSPNAQQQSEGPPPYCFSTLPTFYSKLKFRRLYQSGKRNPHKITQ